MYDKRYNMPTLASYRRFPHIETTISVRCKYAVLHSQLCRFSYRCTQREHFIEAASRLIRDMYAQGYVWGYPVVGMIYGASGVCTRCMRRYGSV